MQENKKIELLLYEAEILSIKINGSLDRQWRVRSISISIWFACIAVGLGHFSDRGEDLSLLLLSIIIPIIYLVIDSRSHAWYRSLLERDSQISQYINDDNYQLPSKSNKAFPVYDPGATLTFGSDRNFRKRQRLTYLLFRPTPMLFYLTQIAGSIYLCIRHLWYL